MKSHRLRFGLAAVILLIAIVLLVMATWPVPRWQQVVPLPPVRLTVPTPISLILFGWAG